MEFVTLDQMRLFMLEFLESEEFKQKVNAIISENKIPTTIDFVYTLYKEFPILFDQEFSRMCNNTK